MTETVKKTTRPKDEIGVSFEEAAHAVLAISVGIKFEKVTLVPDKSYRAYLDLGEYKINGMFELVGLIETAMAGAIGRAYAAKKKITMDLIKGSDLEEITRLLTENKRFITRNEWPHFMSWILFRCHLHLVQRWASVERIAKALRATKTLTYNEAKELMVG